MKFGQNAFLDILDFSSESVYFLSVVFVLPCLVTCSRVSVLGGFTALLSSKQNSYIFGVGL